jgi:hypothetical protein
MVPLVFRFNHFSGKMHFLNLLSGMPLYHSSLFTPTKLEIKMSASLLRFVANKL